MPIQKKCPKCDKILIASTSVGYKYQCLYCDEDFFEIETALHPIEAINDHLNTITDLLATTKELDKDFITAILRHIKGLKATLRKEVLK